MAAEHDNSPIPDRMKRDWWHILALPYLFFLILPIVAIFTRSSLADLYATLNQRQVIQAIMLSLATSASTMLLTILIGTPVAYLLNRQHNNWWRLLDTLIDLPTVLPPSVAGVALLMAFGRRGLLGPWLEAVGISLPFTFAGVVVAQTFVASPFYIRAAALGFSAISQELKQAAGLDGANRWQVLRYIILPLSWTALLSGCVMTWARAMGEFGATIIFAGNFPGRTQTMPLAIYLGFELDLSVALILSVILVCFSFLILLLVKGFLHRQVDQQ